MIILLNLPNPYESKNYKYLIIVPALLIVFSLALIFTKGLHQGVDLRGGILLTVQSREAVDVASLKVDLANVAATPNIRTFQGPSGTGIEIEVENSEKLAAIEEKVKELQKKDGELLELEINASLATGEELTRLTQRQVSLNAEILTLSTQVLSELNDKYSGDDGHAAVRKTVEEYGKAQDAYRASILQAVEKNTAIQSYSFREVGPSLSKFFLEKSREILLYSFILAAIVVFIVFRSFIPSFAVIIGAVTDIVITLGAMSLFDIPLTLASIAGLLMLIGFSLDTDIMLTMRVLKRKEGTPSQRVFNAFKTGALMNLTTIGAFSVLALAGLYLQIPTYFEIGIVATLGGFIDFAATWGANAVLVLMYAEKKEATQA